MTESILNSTKKNLGITADYTQFDSDIIMHINSAFATLHQLGIGPLFGFMIEDASTSWDDFLLGDNRLNSVKTYVYYKVRLAFDPPGSSYHVTAMQDAIRELEWRLNVVREGVVYGVPIGGSSDPGNVTLDGGTPSDTSSTTTGVFDGGTP